MDEMAAHEKGLFLLLVTIPVEPLFVLMFSHLLSSLLNDASHNFSSPERHGLGLRLRSPFG